jgi:uncharacterized membrane protein
MAPDIRRNLLTGTVTVIPILVTIFIFSFFMNLLSGIGRPKLIVLANAVKPLSSDLARWLLEVPWLSSTLAIALTVLMLYLLGWSMHRLVGRQILRSIEEWLERIPLVTTVYGSTKKLVEAFQADTGRPQKVVLIQFPHARMKAVGLVTRTFIDEGTGEELAAVYVPTAPNPTGGYLEIVPVNELVTLDWTVDEAMTFVLSGGTTAPARIRFSSPRSGAPPAPTRLDAAGGVAESRDRGGSEVPQTLRSGAGCRTVLGPLAARDPAP